jgi:hypothetical protein
MRGPGGIDVDAPHLRPWRRSRYVLALLALIAVLLCWFAVAASLLLASREPATGALCATVCAGMVLVVPGLGFAIGRLRGLRQAASSYGGNDEALALLRGARYQEAARAWDDVCRRARFAPALHAIYVMNLGVAWVHLGHIAAGRVLIERGRESGWLGAAALTHVVPASTVSLALALALQGELAAGRALIEGLAPRLGEARRSLPLFVEAVISAREGRTVTIEDATLRDAEQTLMVGHLRGLRLVATFSRASHDGVAYRDTATQAAVEAIGVRPGELDFLGAEWPAMRAFLAAHGLLASKP